MSSIDFDLIINAKFKTGIYFWDEPQGYFYYITFVTPNSKNKKKFDLHVAGILINKRYNRFIHKYTEIINGYLHNTMNRYYSILLRHNYSLSNMDIEELTSLDLTEVRSLLHELRTKVHDIFLDELKPSSSTLN